jgi:hypothetical protein
MDMQNRIDKPWFRRKRIGVGRRPASWQGWLVTLVVAAAVTGLLHLIRH